jgi:hypothetical protein
MTENPSVESSEPVSPPHDLEGEPRRADAPRRSRRKKVLAPVVLFFSGVALLALGLALYPRRAAALATASPSVYVTGNSSEVNSNIEVIDYRVDQVHPDLAKVTIEVLMGSNSWPPGAHIAIGLTLTGQYMTGCSPKCNLLTNPMGHNGSIATADTDLSTGMTAEFLVAAPSFGEPSNGVTAEVTFPEIDVGGTASGPQILSVQYDGIPSANSYDWSTDPPQILESSDAEWVEPITNQNAFSQIVVGNNHAAQQRDSNFTLITGILVGIGGSALVAAVQETLHD